MAEILEGKEIDYPYPPTGANLTFKMAPKSESVWR
jgi:hypothetical protein